MGAKAGGLEVVHELHTRHPRPQLSLKLFYEATVTFICAQNWGVLVKGPSHVAEQLSRQNPCKRVQDSFEHPRQT